MRTLRVLRRNSASSCCVYAGSIPGSALLCCCAPRLSSECEFPNWRCASSAEDREAVRLRLLWRELHLRDTVRWLGDVTAGELAAEYNGAEVFCLPSVQEGFGIVFLEAMAAGKPIVATHAAAVPEVVRHGLLVKPESHDALADALETLYGNSQLRASLADQGRQDVESYDMRRVARRFMETASTGTSEGEVIAQ